MKQIAIIGGGSIGMAVSTLLANAQISSGEFVVVDTIQKAREVVGVSALDPEPYIIRASQPIPEVIYPEHTKSGKRPRTVRRMQERKNKRKR